MANVTVYNMEGKEVGTMELNDAVFGVEINEHLVHMAVVNQLANNRQGTQKAKTRSEVSGGGRKPWRQKGTGHARQGSTRAPQWTGGGVVFAPVPRDYSFKMNKKEKKAALKSVLTSKVQESKIVVLDELKMDAIKTKDFAKVMSNLKVDNALVVTAAMDTNVIMSAKNIPGVATSVASDINVYDAIYALAERIPSEKAVWIDKESANYRLYEAVGNHTKVITKDSPVILMKAMKNACEAKNIREAHIKDGVAVTRFMHWLKTHAGKEKITEISAADRLEEFRKEMDGFIEQSFDSIIGYAEHGAIVHYEPTPETDIPLTENGLFLTDTGGGYLEGSTDISRTFAFGKLTQRMKEDFTTVLQCNFNLAHAVFLEGTTGYNLDVLARMPAWRRGINFNHGTGHDVGYLMNIHEASCGFRCAIREKEHAPLMAGLVITDEPGIYIEGSHGVRTENELLVREGEKNEYGQFLYFEPITYVPIDLDAIIPEMLTDQEREQLNDYHKKVYEIVAPHLNDDEREWLKEYTRAI